MTIEGPCGPRGWYREAGSGKILRLSLDEAIEYLADDELLEVTPESYRIRKRILDTEERGKQTKKAKEQFEDA